MYRQCKGKVKSNIHVLNGMFHLVFGESWDQERISEYLNILGSFDKEAFFKQPVDWGHGTKSNIVLLFRLCRNPLIRSVSILICCTLGHCNIRPVTQVPAHTALYYIPARGHLPRLQISLRQTYVCQHERFHYLYLSNGRLGTYITRISGRPVGLPAAGVIT